MVRAHFLVMDYDENPSQKFRLYESQADIEISSEDDDSEEMMFTKLECAEMFRDEVRKWLKQYGAPLLKAEPVPAPAVVQTPYKKPRQAVTSKTSSKKAK